MNTTIPFYFKELSAKNETIISLEEGYLKVISIGERNAGYARNLWQNIMEACEECECYKILGIALTTKAEYDKHAIENIEIFYEFGIHDDLKIAWVEKNPEYENGMKLIEDLVLSRKLPWKLFRDEEEARSWLLYN